jgi:DNA invertase Pin-like site-specific DNA recombinase
MTLQRFVTYYRVSTQRQGRSGLGLEAQQAAVTAFLTSRNGLVVGEYREIESGRKNDRQQLAAAIQMCRLTNSTLLIAKLDRLARNVAFISALMESGIDFTAADFPEANRLTVHILAAVAEHEAMMISERTKAALAARKARGLPLGNQASLRPADREGAARAGAAWSKKAADHAAMVLPAVLQMKGAGMSLSAMARDLAKRGFMTVRGGRWTAAQVSAVLRRAI